MRDTPHGAARRGYSIADELPPPEYVEQLKTHRVFVFGGLLHASHDDRLGLDERPVVEIQVGPGGRFLQHVFFGDRRETAAALQVGRDDAGDVERHVRALPRPAEWHDGDRCARNPALGDFHGDVGQCRAAPEGRRDDPCQKYSCHVTRPPRLVRAYCSGMNRNLKFGSNSTGLSGSGSGEAL